MKQVVVLNCLIICLCFHSFGNNVLISSNCNGQLIGTCNDKYMVNDTTKNIILSYLKFYEKKDLNSIEKIFSDDIILRDWKIRVEGKEMALIETKKNFESVDSIQIEVISLYENKNSVAAELKIIINGSQELYVVDVITINPQGRITSIKAFIGRGN